MQLASLLGFRYIWVDALCIIQDDPTDQSYQIGEVATTYSSASLTILAASGENSDAGLPGLGPSSVRQYEQQEVVIQPPSETNNGLSVMNTLKSYPHHWDASYSRGLKDADISKWSQRAWTLQEKAFSRRSLTFTDE